MALQTETNSNMAEDGTSDYSMATYIRQNSMNFERLNSVTESVCLTEEQRRLVDKELFRETALNCTCSPKEYCSSECKEDSQKPHTSKQKQTGIATIQQKQNLKKLKTSDTCSCKHSCHGKTNMPSETTIDMSHISSKYSIDSTEDKKSLCTYLKWAVLLLFMVVSTVIITILVYTYLLPHLGVYIPAQNVSLETETVDQSRQTIYTPNGTRSTSEEFVSFSLDLKRFVKGGRFLRWEANEISEGITLTSHDCLKLSRTALYQIYSKITFEFGPGSKSNAVYHNVQLLRDDSDIPEILGKDVVTIPPFARLVRRLKSSLVLVLRKFQADDVICVNVQDTNLVYESRIDNSLQIIQKM